MKYGVTFMITLLSHLESNNHTVGKFSNGIRVVHFVSLKHETKLITSNLQVYTTLICDPV